MVITPEIVAVVPSGFRLSGKIDYDGNVEYLPRTIVADSQSEAQLTLRYRHDVSYGRDSVNQLLPLINPLTIIGFPIGADTVVVKSTLEVLRRDAVVKAYEAACIIDKHRTIFWEGETMTGLRRRGLMAVRDNIEAQMRNDSEFLLKAAGSL